MGEIGEIDIKGKLEESLEKLREFPILNMLEIREQLLDVFEEVIKLDSAFVNRIKAAINNIEINGDHLIHSLARRGDTEDVKRILKLGADLSLANSHNSNLLHIAALNEKPLIVQTIINNWTPEEKAILLNAQNHNGATPLHCAVITNQFDIVILLLNSGAKGDIKDEKGNIPVNIAEFMGFEKIAHIFQGHANIESHDIEPGSIPERSPLDRSI
jgi:ankyrin repeat protein